MQEQGVYRERTISSDPVPGMIVVVIVVFLIGLAIGFIFAPHVRTGETGNLKKLSPIPPVPTEVVKVPEGSVVTIDLGLKPGEALPIKDGREVFVVNYQQIIAGGRVVTFGTECWLQEEDMVVVKAYDQEYDRVLLECVATHPAVPNSCPMGALFFVPRPEFEALVKEYRQQLAVKEGVEEISEAELEGQELKRLIDSAIEVNKREKEG